MCAVVQEFLLFQRTNSARTGIKIEAVAVFDVISVIMAVNIQMTNTISPFGITPNASIWVPSQVDSPDTSEASAIAKPPPNKKTMPHGTFSSTTFQLRHPSIDFTGLVSKF